MDAQTTIDLLNRLLAAESRSLLPRLAEAAPFVSWTSADDVALVRRMIDEEREDCERLVRVILELRGSPVPATPDASLAGLHYLELNTLMPQITADVRRRAEQYERAGGCDLPPAVASLIGDLTKRRREHLAALEALAAGAPSPSS